MYEKLWLALSCAGSQMSLSASRDSTDPNSFRIWLLSSFKTKPRVLPLVQSWYRIALSDLLFSVPKQALLQTCLLSALCEELASAYSIQYGTSPRYLMTANKAPGR